MHKNSFLEPISTRNRNKKSVREFENKSSEKILNVRKGKIFPIKIQGKSDKIASCLDLPLLDCPIKKV